MQFDTTHPEDLKMNGKWKIANFMWTVEKDRCPTGPSGLSDATPR